MRDPAAEPPVAARGAGLCRRGTRAPGGPSAVLRRHLVVGPRRLADAQAGPRRRPDRRTRRPWHVVLQAAAFRGDAVLGGGARPFAALPRAGRTTGASAVVTLAGLGSDPARNDEFFSRFLDLGHDVEQAPGPPGRAGAGPDRRRRPDLLRLGQPARRRHVGLPPADPRRHRRPAGGAAAPRHHRLPALCCPEQQRAARRRPDPSRAAPAAWSAPRLPTWRQRERQPTASARTARPGSRPTVRPGSPCSSGPGHRAPSTATRWPT